MSPIVYSVLITLVRPQNYNWDDFKKEKLSLEKVESDLTTVHHDHVSRTGNESLEDGGRGVEAKELKRWGRIAVGAAAATFVGHWIIWPLPMYGSGYIFGKGVCFIQGVVLCCIC